MSASEGRAATAADGVRGRSPRGRHGVSGSDGRAATAADGVRGRSPRGGTA